MAIPQIGPFQFLTMTGRVQPPTIASQSSPLGPSVGDRVNAAYALRTTQSLASFPSAWSQAVAYRALIGAAVPVVDAGGMRDAFALVCDVAVEFDRGALIAEWSLASLPSVGQAAIVPPVALPVVLTGAAMQQFSITSSVGTTTWRGLTGDLQPTITRQQIANVANTARQYRITEYSQPQIERFRFRVFAEAANESAAQRIAAIARLQIGPAIVGIAGVGVRIEIESVETYWQDAATSPAGGSIIAAQITAKQADDAGGQHFSIVQFAKTWGTWATDKAARCSEVELGSGARIGAATIMRDLSGSEPVNRVAQWVRVLDGLSMTPVWHGFVESRSTQGGRGQAAVEVLVCSEPLGALRQCEFFDPRVEGLIGTMPVESLEVFNPEIADVSRGNLHDEVEDKFRRRRGDGVPIKRWTALQAVEYIMREWRREYPGGPQWTLSGQTGCLDYELPPTDLRGENALECLLTLTDASSGSVIVPRIAADGTAELHVKSLATTALPMGTATLPANDDPIDADLSAAQVVAFVLGEDGGTAYDRIAYEGDPPENIATLKLTITKGEVPNTAQLIPDWTSAEETAWDSASEAERAAPALSHVWRRWALPAAWSGQHWDADADALAADSKCVALLRSLDAQGGETGDITPDIGGAYLPLGDAFRFSRALELRGIPPGSDPWSESYGDRGISGPMIYTGAPGSMADASNNFTTEVLPDSCQILFGHDGQGSAVKAAFAGGALVTIGIHNPIAWRKSWRRTRADRPRDMERGCIVKSPLTYTTVHHGTILGVDEDGNPLVRDGAIKVGWNDGVRCSENASRSLALFRLWHETPAPSLRATYASTASRSNLLPINWTSQPTPDPIPQLGQMITTAKIPCGRSRTETRAVNSVVSSISIDLENGQTTINADRTQPVSGAPVFDPPAPPKRKPAPAYDSFEVQGE